MRLYFDVETTGIPQRHLPWNHESQPSIVSIAWALADESDGFYHHFLIKPDGWTIDEEGKAFAAHRIPQARCEELGKPIASVIAEFADEFTRATQICAYNIDFDIDMTRIACERAKLPWLNFPPRFDILPLAQAYCQLPPTERMIVARRRGFKPPKLSEALKIICNEEFPDAHDALADVRATIRIHRRLEEIANDL